ncbi:MAG: hypothetical protein EXR71_09850 [Myxococcales bacterium]|nr:hypothetical protein [Myxococcales bacterium]
MTAGAPEALLALLHASGRPFSMVDHAEARSAAEASVARGTPLSMGGKSVLMRVERVGDVVVVVGSDRKLVGRLLRRALGVQRYRFSTSEELRALTGLAYGELPAWAAPLFPATLVVGEDFAAREEVIFAAASATRSIRMRVPDWLAAARPRVVAPFTEPA